jgi:hypothetical protein
LVFLSVFGRESDSKSLKSVSTQAKGSEAGGGSIVGSGYPWGEGGRGDERF